MPKKSGILPSATASIVVPRSRDDWGSLTAHMFENIFPINTVYVPSHFLYYFFKNESVGEFLALAMVYILDTV